MFTLTLSERERAVTLLALGDFYGMLEQHIADGDHSDDCPAEEMLGLTDAVGQRLTDADDDFRESERAIVEHRLTALASD